MMNHSINNFTPLILETEDNNGLCHFVGLRYLNLLLVCCCLIKLEVFMIDSRYCWIFMEACFVGLSYLDHFLSEY